MVEPTIDQRLAAIETRLAALERQFDSARPQGSLAEPTLSESIPQALPTPLEAPPPVSETPPVTQPLPPILETPPVVPLGFEISASTILGWAGAGALLLAAAYFVRLAIAEGWLTPWLQVAIAALAGGAMIGGAFLLRPRDTRYSSLLGAGGIAILYVAVYGAHVYHGLIGPLPAIVAVSAVSALSLSLHALFKQPVYIAFALVGTYLTPFLLPRGSIHDLAVYLVIWNVVYAGYAIWQRNRGLYLAAVYAFLVVFGWGWGRELEAFVAEAARAHLPRLDYDSVPWRFAVAFLWLQACLFLAAAVAVSARARRPLSELAAWAHFPALSILYGIQHAILSGESWILGRATTDLASWAGIALALAVYAAWAVGRAILEETPRASLQVAHAFAAIVFVHAIYFDLVPADWRPLFALGVAAAVALGLTAFGMRAWPWVATGAFLFVAGYVQLKYSWGLRDPVVARSALLLAYPALLYTLYFKTRQTEECVDGREAWRWLLLAFAAIVFVHAVYFDLVPAEWRPLVAISVAAGVALNLSTFGTRAWPWVATGAFLFVAGYAQVAYSWEKPDLVVARSALSLAYPALLYALYWRTRQKREAVDGSEPWRWLLLAVGHAMALGAAVWLVGEWLGSPDTTVERLWLSLAWAGIGLAWLMVATARGDRTLARSTLGIFAAFALKVVFADLDHAGPLVRVGILVVLGVTLYAGGWIYRRVLHAGAERSAPAG